MAYYHALALRIWTHAALRLRDLHNHPSVHSVQQDENTGSFTTVTRGDSSNLGNATDQQQYIGHIG
jgi:hypothetical protein